MCPLSVPWGLLWRPIDGTWCVWFTLGGVMGCPVAPHPRCAEADIFLGPVDEWVIITDAHGLLGSPGDAICLPTYYDETVHTERMSHSLAMLVDGEEAQRCSPGLCSIYSCLQSNWMQIYL